MSNPTCPQGYLGALNLFLVITVMSFFLLALVTFLTKLVKVTHTVLQSMVSSSTAIYVVYLAIVPYLRVTYIWSTMVLKFGCNNTAILSLICVGFELTTDVHETDLCCLIHSASSTNRLVSICSICSMICLCCCKQ